MLVGNQEYTGVATNASSAEQSQRSAVVAKRRSRSDVISAAFELLEEGGLDAVTLNAIARRLGAHLNSVSFQVKTKGRLLDLMADEVLGHLNLDNLPVDPVQRVETLLKPLSHDVVGLP
jgi:TetR/AcrR family tetracycline transcriptional repressor